MRRSHLVHDVLAEFGKKKGANFVFVPTQVSFVDEFGGKEEGDDEGGLTAELFNLFFREVFHAEHGLFEQAADGDGAAHLPRADAPADALRLCGRVLLKAIVDDHPIGGGLAPFVLEWLVDAHERRVFSGAAAALAQLRCFDARLAACWGALLGAPAPQLAGLSLGWQKFHGRTLLAFLLRWRPAAM